MRSQRNANFEMLIALIVLAVVVFFAGYALGTHDTATMIVDGYEGRR